MKTIFLRLILACLISTAWVPTTRLEAAGTWRQIKNPAPEAIDHFLLLYDGSVMGLHHGHQFILRPDSRGNYENGVWSALAPKHEVRALHGAQVLTNGMVFLVGGEGGTGPTGAEIYDPVSDQWHKTSPPLLGGDVFRFPISKLNWLSDSMSMLLPNGSVLIGPAFPAIDNSTVLYNVAEDRWSENLVTANPVVKTPYSGNSTQLEANWVKLPDDSILTVDYLSTNVQRYIPKLNKWVTDAPTVNSIHGLGVYTPGANLAEPGPGVLLPNGKVIYFGGDGSTAIYTPSGSEEKGTWSVGPSMPPGRGSPDGAAAMMPNGKVLFTALSKDNSTSILFEYDPVANSIVQVDSPIRGQNVMLVLPDGSILVPRGQGDPQPYLYRAEGAPDAAWRPVILGITANADGTYRVSGTQLNGLSEGAYMGDDAQMSSNYPIFAFKNGEGRVWYARTVRNYSTSVQTGSRVLQADVELPGGLTAGNYQVSAIANGIVSEPVLFSAPATLLPSVRGVSATSSGPTAVVVRWNRLDNTETGYRIDRSTDGKVYAPLVSVSASTASYTDTTALPLTSYHYRVMGTNATGTGGLRGVALASTPSSVPLPQDWVAHDIGDAAGPGASGLSSQGTGLSLVISGAGREFGDRQDQFHWAHRTVEGDVLLTARIQTTTADLTESTSALLFRADLDPSAAEVMLAYNPVGGITFRTRALYNRPVETQQPAVAPPPGAKWMRLARFGSTFVAYASMDGSAWSRLGALTAQLPLRAQVGLAVTSGDRTRFAVTTFERVVIEVPARTLVPGTVVGCPLSFVPPGGEDVLAFERISLAANYGLGLVRGGGVVGFRQPAAGLGLPPESMASVTAISAGETFAVALRRDGTAVAWGDAGASQTSVPGVVTNRFREISAGASHGVAILEDGNPADGAVVQWGDRSHGQSSAPPGLRAVMVSAGGSHTLALRNPAAFVSDVVAWGDDAAGQSSVPFVPSPIAVSAGGAHSLAVTAYGDVVAWGANDAGQTNTPVTLKTAIAAAAGRRHSLALRSDGTVVAWGDNSRRACDVPPGLDRVIAIAAGDGTSFALTEEGRVVQWGGERVELSLGQGGFLHGEISWVQSGASLPLTARLSLSCLGPVSRVDFFDGATLLGSVSREPFQWSWNVTGVGAHELRASAVTASGVVSSDIARVQVVDVSGTALRWDGRDGLAEFANPPSLAGRSFTIEAWVQAKASTSHNFFLLQGSGERDATLHIGFRDGNRIDFAFGGDDLVVDGSLNDEGWHHWAFAFVDSTRSRQIYKDGVLLASDTAAGVYAGSGALVLGAAPLIGSYFNGALDEVRIWDHARSADQIAANWKRILSGQEAGLAAYWSMSDDRTQRILEVVSGRSAALQGATAFAAGAPDLGLPLTGKLTPQVVWNPPATLAYGTSLGVDQLNAWTGLPGTFTYSPASGALLGLGDQTLTVTFTPTDSSRYTATSKQVNIQVVRGTPSVAWATPAAIKYGTPLGSAQLNATSSVPGRFSYDPEPGTVPRAGVRVLAATFIPDNPALYTSTRVSAVLLVKPAPLVVFPLGRTILQGFEPGTFDFGVEGLVNEDSLESLNLGLEAFTTATASSPPGNYPVTVQGGHHPDYEVTYRAASLTVGVGALANGALKLGGGGAAVQIDAAPNLANQSFTVEVWVRNALPREASILLFQGGQGTDIGLHLGFRAQGSFIFGFYGDDLDTPEVYQDTEWHHWACAYDASTKRRTIHRDGVLVAENVAQQNYQGSGVMTLGNLQGSYPFQGELDELRIWNGARSTDEIRASYQRMISGTEPGLLAAWRFDEVSGPTVLDVRANANGRLVAGADRVFSGVSLGAAASGPVVTPLTWSAPSSIIYGTPLGAAQLNASATVAGAFSYSPSSGTVPPVGSVVLTARFSPTNQILYASSTLSRSLTVTPAPLAVRADDKSMVVGGAFPELTASYSGFVNADTRASLSSVATLSTTATPSSPPGSYPITVSGASSPNYAITYQAGTFTVLPKPNTPPTLTAITPIAGRFQNQNYNLTYDALAAAADESDADGDAVSFVIQEVLAGSFTLNGDAVKPGQTVLAAGQVLAWVPPANRSGRIAALAVRATDGKSSSGSNVVVEIDVVPPGKPVITWNAPGAIVYGTPLGSAQLNATASVPGSFSYSPPAGAILPGGNATLTATFTPADSVRFTTVTATVTCAISKAPLTIQAEDKSMIAGGVLPPFTARYVGFVNGDTASKLTAQPVLTTSASAQSPAGVYTIDIRGAASGDYDIRYQPGQLTVVAAATAGAALSLDGVDDRATISPAPSLANKSFTVEAWVRNGRPGSLQILFFQGGEATDAGLHLGFQQSGQFLFGFYGDDLNSSASYTDTGWHHWAAVYDAPTKMRRLYRDGELTDEGKANSNFTGSGSIAIGHLNNRFPFKGQLDELRIWSVARTAAEIRANHSRAVAADAAGLETYLRFDEAQGVNSVDYARIASGVNDARLANGAGWVRSEVRLTPALEGPMVPVLNWSAPSGITYGTALSTSQFNARASVEGDFTYVPAVGAIPQVGTVTLQASFNPRDPVLYAVTATNQSLTVGKAPLSIRANDVTVQVGAPFPEFTASYDGFVNGETVAVLTTVPRFTTSATSTSPPGNYPITVAGASAENYQITYQAGTLTLVAKPNSPPLLTSVAPLPGPFENQVQVIPFETLRAASNASDPDGDALTFVISGLSQGSLSVNGAGAKVGIVVGSGDVLGWQPPANQSGRITAFQIRASDGRATSAADVAVVINVQPRTAPVITWPEPAPIRYGTPVGSVQLSASSDVPGTFAYSPVAGVVPPAGRVTLSATFIPADAVRFTSASATVNLTVTKAPLNVQAEDVSIEAGSLLPALKARYSGFVNNDGPSALERPVVLTTTATSNSEAGTYPITVSGAVAANYEITFLPGVLTIVPASNPAPVANAQSVQTTINRPIRLQLTGSLPSGPGVRFEVVRLPAHGRLSGAPPSVLYVPEPNYTGADSFSFKLTGGGRESLPASVSIQIAGTPFRPAGSALNLDGVNDSMVVNGPVNLANQSFTIEAWVKSTAQNVNNFFVMQGDGAANRTLHIGFRANNTPTFAFGNNDLNTPQAYTDQNWHHWAFTF